MFYPACEDNEYFPKIIISHCVWNCGSKLSAIRGRPFDNQGGLLLQLNFFIFLPSAMNQIDFFTCCATILHILYMHVSARQWINLFFSPAIKYFFMFFTENQNHFIFFKKRQVPTQGIKWSAPEDMSFIIIYIFYAFWLYLVYLHFHILYVKMARHGNNFFFTEN